MKETNFSTISIILATLDKFPPWEPLFPEPPPVNVNEIWPDCTIDWLRKENEKDKIP